MKSAFELSDLAHFIFRIEYVNPDHSDFRRLGREMLYELAWEQPLSIVAPKYGVSDVAFKKRCKGLGVPTPPRGYWAKVAAGLKVKRAPLPARWSTVKRKRRTPTSPEEIKRFVAPELDHTVRRRTAEVSATRKALNLAKLNDYNLLDVGGPGILRSKLSKASVARAMWLWSELIPILGLYGLELLLIATNTQVTDGKQTLDFELKEMVSKFVPQDEGSSNRTPSYHPLDRPRLRWQPTGVLTFRCERSRIEGATHEWRDTQNNPLDGKLDQVATGIQSLLERMQAYRDQQAHEEAVVAEQRRLRKIEEERARAELERRQRLAALADGHASSKAIRSFLRDIRLEVARRGLVLESVDWLTWADGVADSMDPIPDVISAFRAGHDPLDQ